MFLPGDRALLRETNRTLVVEATPAGFVGGIRWPVLTNEGIYEEADLQMAHPSCFSWLDETQHRRSRHDPEVDALLGLDSPAKLGYTHPLASTLGLLVKKLVEDGEVDFNGHWMRGGADEKAERRKDLREIVFRHGHFFASQMLRADAEQLSAAVAEGRDDTWVNLGEGIVYHSRECPYCGANDIEVETNGKMLRIVGTCPKPDGLPPNNFELNVPSGKIVVANDLRALFPVMENGHDINGLRGLRGTAQDYAATGLAHAFVGNSCPDLYRLAGDRLKIASAPTDEYWNGTTFVKYKRKPKFDGKKVADICTDLWWYSICDYDEFVRRCEHFTERIVAAGGDVVTTALEHFGCTVVDVRPGVYCFHHDDDVDDDDHRKETVYTRIEWVRDPDLVKDFLLDHLRQEITAGQYVQRCVARYPSLFTHRMKYKGVTWSDLTNEEQEHAWQRMADRIFCSNGNGVKWHERGFPQETIPAGTPDIPVPSGMFRQQLYWYPMSEGYAAILDAAGITAGGKRSRGDCQKLAPSFAKLAFQVLASMISFGVSPRDGAAGREVQQSRKVMGLALAAYRALGDAYPEHSNPEYLAWVRDGDRADQWVRAFDLGPQKTERHVQHFEAQKVLPDGTEYVELDFSKMKHGYFSNGQGWARKEDKDAKWFALRGHQPNSLLNDEDNGWFGNAGNAVPLYSVARVVKLGQQAHTGERIVEVAFDYGTKWMRDATKRKAFNERECVARVISEVEYKTLLPVARAAYKKASSTR